MPTIATSDGPRPAPGRLDLDGRASRSSQAAAARG